MHILHIISGLETGGAETVLYRLVTNLDRSRFKSTIISLTNFGQFGSRLLEAGIPVHTLGMKRGIPNPLSLITLVGLLKDIQPSLVQTWMFHADLIGGLAASFSGGIPVVWNIRNSTLDPKRTRWTTLWTIRACARLSNRIPAKIIVVSEEAKHRFSLMGYASEKMVHHPNGIPTGVYFPSADFRESVRKELDIPDEAFIFGTVARFHPQKDYNNLLEAAARVTAARKSTFLVCCGDGVDHQNEALLEMITKLGLGGRVRLLGRRDDIPRILNGLDLFVLASAYGEGFPNAIAEAMACSIPAVCTDVGDSAMIVAKYGKVVPPREPEALASAILGFAELPHHKRREIGHMAAERIENCFSLSLMVSRYADLYRSLLS